jgi:hypothetical protein
MECLPVPTPEMVCDLVAALVSNLEMETPRDFVDLPAPGLLRAYNALSEAYLFGHMFTCGNCRTSDQVLRKFWGTYYLLTKAGSTSRTPDEDWPADIAALAHEVSSQYAAWESSTLADTDARRAAFSA